MKPREVGSSHDACVVHQFGDHERRFRVESARRQMSQVGLSDRVEQQIARHRNTATEYEDLRIENRAERGASLAEPGSEFAKRLSGTRITGTDQLRNIRPRESSALLANCSKSEADTATIRNRVSHAEEGTTRAVLLDAAARTTAAGQTVWHDSHVAELSANAESAAE